MRLLVWLSCVLLLGGCATGYGKNSIFGGYWHKEGPGELVEIGFNGNGYTKEEKVELYLLFRSAEIAKERGKPWFSIYPTIGHAIVDEPLTEANANSLGGKPFGKVYTLLHDAQVPGALNTDDVLVRYRADVKGATAGKGAK